jgi:hypothetical protein
MKFQHGATNGQTYGRACEAKTPAEAKEIFDALVDLCLERNPNATRSWAKSTVRTNIGYYAGYYSTETQRRVGVLYPWSD